MIDGENAAAAGEVLELAVPRPVVVPAAVQKEERRARSYVNVPNRVTAKLQRLHGPAP